MTDRQEHGATYYLAIIATCKCGWRSRPFVGKDAEDAVRDEYRAHMETHPTPPSEPVQAAQSEAC